MTLYEHSAGGVIFRREGLGIQILLIKDKNGNWSFPKGLIEDKEAELETAVREIAEETGLKDLTFVELLGTTGYFYRFAGNLVRKKVDYFLFAYLGKGKPKAQREEGISQVRWFDPKEARKVIGYTKTNMPILKKALKEIYAVARGTGN